MQQREYKNMTVTYSDRENDCFWCVDDDGKLYKGTRSSTGKGFDVLPVETAPEPYMTMIAKAGK